MKSRVDTSPISQWWWTIDRWFLAAFIVLMGTGILLSFAASPAVAGRLGLSETHFVQRQIMFMVPAFLVMIGVSFMTPNMVRASAIAILLIGVLMLLGTLFLGAEVKGSQRWIRIAGISLQPSEFVKPAFVVVCAWLFAMRETRPGFSGGLLATLLLSIVIALLIAQPDLGQTMLISAAWAAMFFMAGLSWLWIVLLGIIGAGGAFVAYSSFPHVTKRIDQFLTGEGDTFQVQKAIESIVNGGWLGQGPGEGTIKQILPDSHTDFVFAVAGEEFGILVCALITLVFGFIVLRGLMLAAQETDAFKRFAVSGLVIIFGLQAFINIGVNLRLLPAKGMTLPFVSYGGSSLIAVALGMGLVLALTRRGPQLAARSRPGNFDFQSAKLAR